MDIIVTTPRGEMANAAQEAADCITAGGGEYFRRLPSRQVPSLLAPGDRCYYVEDGYVRGFAVISRVVARSGYERCETTGRTWPPGLYIYMDARSWRWIKPIPMKGFQGFRYAALLLYVPDPADAVADIIMQTKPVVYERGGWLDPRPATPVPGRGKPTDLELFLAADNAIGDPFGG